VAAVGYGVMTFVSAEQALTGDDATQGNLSASNQRDRNLAVHSVPEGCCLDDLRWSELAPRYSVPQFRPAQLERDHVGFRAKLQEFLDDPARLARPS
jgi:hypothetical protein